MIQEALMSDIRDFMKSRIILTAAELDIFTLLYETSLSAADLSQLIAVDQRAATRILDCLVLFGLLAKQESSYTVTEKGGFLSSRHSETILPMVLHMNHLWASWSDLTDIVRGGTERELNSGLKFTEKDWKAFIGAMHVAARALATEIADFYDASMFKRLLDIGGASGTYTIAFLKKNPHMKAVLFDLPEVIPLARERVESEGFLERVDFVSGDFYEEPLPGECDFALLSAVIHQNSPNENLLLFRNIHSALPPGGVLLIRDHIMDESRLKPPAGALFAINMLINTHGGDTYTYDEVKHFLREAGFSEINLIKSGDRMDCLVEARK